MLPRPIIPGATVLVTRRTTQRAFLLAPAHPWVAQIFLYCLAIALERTGILLHAVTVMSNHYHLVVTDPFGRIPEMCQWLNQFVAKAMNARYGRWENFWATEAPSYVRLIDADDILSKIVYTATNPVAAGLVAHGEDWPGVRLFTPGKRVIRRPEGFFRADGPMPETATLNVVAPPIGSSAHQACRQVMESIAAEESRIRAEFRSTGRSFNGVRSVLAQRHDDAPKTTAPRRKLSPKVAARNRWQRIEALQQNRAFVIAYRVALRAWKIAPLETVFPFGTYAMVKRFSARSAPS